MRTVHDEYGNTVEIPGPFDSLDAIKAHNRESGYHFFSDGAMRFFRSEVYKTVYAGRFFITSEKGPKNPRRYTVRAALNDGTVSAIAPEGKDNGFQAFRSLADAEKFAESLTTGYL